MNELELYNKLNEITETADYSLIFENDDERARQIAEHRSWLRSIRHERPQPSISYKVGIYIRYFNQTKYDNYLSYHKKQFTDTVALCPNWTLVDFYIDEGSTAPNIESAPELRRLIEDCFDGKVDLIITQKVSNMSKKTAEITLLSRILAAQKHPVGIYFISEDIFTLASYYQDDLHDPEFFPASDWKTLPDEDDEEVRLLSDDRQ
ncbi:MAG: recombinase family protein [Lachnospiraceae bacterium]|nr:recombinase family protein [Lachnospiraceae bacterium]